MDKIASYNSSDSEECDSYRNETKLQRRICDSPTHSASLTGQSGISVRNEPEDDPIPASKGLTFFTTSDSEDEEKRTTEGAHSDMAKTAFDGEQDCLHAENILPGSSFWQENQSSVDWNNTRAIWGPSDAHLSAAAPQRKRIKVNNKKVSLSGELALSKYDSRITKNDTLKAVACLDDDHYDGQRNVFFVHHRIGPHLNTHASTCKFPRNKTVHLRGHAGVVNRIDWGKQQFSHLICSASMDRTVKIWNVFSSAQSKCVRTLTHHDKAVKGCIWSESGREILSCSYDRTVKLCDVSSGKECLSCDHRDFVTSVQYHPVNKNWVISGSLNALFCWDVRKSDKAFRKYVYKEPFGQFWYFTYGTKDVLERECKDLHKKVKLEMDGKKIDLPEIEGIVILNISSWGGGCQPWQKGGNGGEPVPDSRYNDGMMEVFALYSSFHIAQLQVGLAEPLRLGQAKTVKISLSKGNAPMQVDGEPWEQTPAVISISLHNQATMLANYDS